MDCKNDCELDHKDPCCGEETDIKCECGIGHAENVVPVDEMDSKFDFDIGHNDNVSFEVVKDSKCRTSTL